MMALDSFALILWKIACVIFAGGCAVAALRWLIDSAQTLMVTAGAMMSFLPWAIHQKPGKPFWWVRFIKNDR